MWAEKQPNGKVKFVERYTDPMTLKNHRTSVTMDKDSARTRKLAQEVLRENIDRELSKITSTVKKEDMRLSELVSLYRKNQLVSTKRSTYTRNYHACNSLMKILGEDTIVERLNAGYINEKFTGLNESIGTTNERITRLKALIRWGYENDLIEDIRWIDKLKKKDDTKKKEKLEEKYLESWELKMLLKNMAIPKWKILAELTALSGLRIGEALALEDSDVDLSSREIHVTKTRDSVNNLTDYPKTQKSNRDIYMQDELYVLCKKAKAYMKEERFACGYHSDLFLSDVNGNFLNYYSYNNYLKETAEKVLKKNVKVTTHIMRHTHTSLMAEQGVDLDIISRRLGHSNSKITRDIYYHVTRKIQERDNARIKAIKIL